MAKADPGQSRSLKEILEERKGEPGQNIESDRLKEELKTKEKELKEHKEKVKELEAEKGKERVEVAAEVKEKEPVLEREQKEKKAEEGQEPSKASKAKQAVQKKGIADDVAVILELDEPKQIKALVYLSLKKGIHHAYDVARGLKSPYLLDKFHDALIDKLRGTLVKKGKLKKSYRQEGDEK